MQEHLKEEKIEKTPRGKMQENKAILHIDLDAFFASVEQKVKPHLQNKPVIVAMGGMKGVVSTASYEARVYGIKSAMSITEAKSRHPECLIVPVRMKAYKKASIKVQSILKKYSTSIQTISMDEAFLDLSEYTLEQTDELMLLAKKIKKEIHTQTGLTCSIGIANSKILAKLASEKNKPNGITIISKEIKKQFLQPYLLKKLPGIGPVTTQKCSAVGLETVKDVNEKTDTELNELLGINLAMLVRKISEGNDDTVQLKQTELKSISQEDTYLQNIEKKEEAGHELKKLAYELSARLKKANLKGRTVQIKIKTSDFKLITRASTLQSATDNAEEIYHTSVKLFESAGKIPKIRLLGINISSFSNALQYELDLQIWKTDTELEDKIKNQKETIIDVAYWNMEVNHETYGRGLIKEMHEEWVHILFENENKNRVFDGKIIKLTY